MRHMYKYSNNKYAPKKKKRFRLHQVFLIVVFSSLILFSVSAWNLTEPFRYNRIENDENFHTEVKIVKHYFVPVAQITSLKVDVTLDELQAQNLLTISDNVDIFPNGYSADVVSEDDFINSLTGEQIGLITPDKVKPNMKTLTVDGLNFWDKNTKLDEYPLWFEEKIPDEIGYEFNFEQESVSTIFIGGEIIPARAVDRLGLNVHNNYTYLYDFVRQDIENADLAIAQLENPLMGDPVPCTGCTVFVGDERVAKGLSEVGFDVLAASGNHMGDGGQKAYETTIKALDDAGIFYTGFGKGVDEQMKPAIFDINGQKVGMISADDVSYFYWSNDKNIYGVNTFSTASNGQLKIDNEKIQRISKIKAENEIDYLIIYESWGIEYTNRANAHQVELAHAFIDNGADLVVASHPHWVQNIEFYKEKPIFYALGNFIFDQTHTLPTRQSVVANLYYYEGNLKSIELIPLQTCGYHQTKNDLTSIYLQGEISLESLINKPEAEGCVWWQPRKLSQSSPEFQQILERIFEFSRF